MIRGFLIVSIGSFIGGGMRYLVSCLFNSFCTNTFPFGTFAVNIIGCFIIGYIYGVDWGNSAMSTTTKLMLTTGFCGGFTTFSTFINESSLLLKEHPILSLSYMLLSLVVGMLMLLLGNLLAKA